MTEEKKKIKEVNERIAEKAKELSVVHQCEVTPMCFMTPDGEVVGFLKDPDRILKMRVIDMLNMGQLAASGEVLLQACLIKEESDPRILSEARIHDKIYLGAVMAAQDMVKYYTDQFKKK